jgi:NADH:ubiquinone oxidoreductase subunit K
MAIGLSITLLLQGFLCGYIAMSLVSNNLQRGIAVIIGVVLAVQGAAWGLMIGLALYFLLEYQLVKALESDRHQAKEAGEKRKKEK